MNKVLKADLSVVEVVVEVWLLTLLVLGLKDLVFVLENLEAGGEAVEGAALLTSDSTSVLHSQPSFLSGPQCWRTMMPVSPSWPGLNTR